MGHTVRRNPPSVVELEGDFTHRMLHTRGIRLHVAEAGDPSNPLLLLVHGALGGWFDFKDVIAPLAELGYHVAALDLRGYGMSDKPAPRAGDVTHILAGDIAGAVRTMGHREARIIGADTGAVLADAAQLRYPDLVRSVAALPLSRGAAAAAGRLPSRALRASGRVLDAVLRANLRADTTDAFHGTERFEEALRLRSQAARIDHALPHIAAVSRLRPLRWRGARTAGAHPSPFGPGRLPQVEDPAAFVGGVEKQLL
ncbi:alpha/beta fold hydrolase [Corynebacterium bouchesdurhonense]|uniref:alpha/beta fold hydrolase n=1 Tax=Corynebacterium bouchesdurhonense TaxID=1720192 RepID=UPI000833CF13|nr:alpha/beta hydrolase [Corynebacterium bouchesdurhonense]